MEQLRLQIFTLHDELNFVARVTTTNHQLRTDRNKVRLKKPSLKPFQVSLLPSQNLIAIWTIDCLVIVSLNRNIFDLSNVESKYIAMNWLGAWLILALRGFEDRRSGWTDHKCCYWRYRNRWFYWWVGGLGSEGIIIVALRVCVFLNTGCCCIFNIRALNIFLWTLCLKKKVHPNKLAIFFK